MFAIILAVIAIALTIFLTVVSINYLFEDGSNAAKAEAAKIIQEAAQIRGAILIAKTDGINIDTGSDLSELTPKYLAEVPQSGRDWTLAENMVIKENVNDQVCLAANLSLGFVFTKADTQVRLSKNEDGYIPHCDKESLNPNVPCCDTESSTIIVEG